MMNGDLDERDAATVSAGLVRLGVTAVSAVGLTWDDCESCLQSHTFSSLRWSNCPV